MAVVVGATVLRSVHSARKTKQKHDAEDDANKDEDDDDDDANRGAAAAAAARAHTIRSVHHNACINNTGRGT